jgi:hypothetical protein
MPSKRKNASQAASLADLDAEHQRVRSSSVNLTPAERKLLSDPDWINEDEADAITAKRLEQSEKGKEIPIDEYLRSCGRQILED